MRCSWATQNFPILTGGLSGVFCGKFAPVIPKTRLTVSAGATPPTRLFPDGIPIDSRSRPTVSNSSPFPDRHSTLRYRDREGSCHCKLSSGRCKLEQSSSACLFRNQIASMHRDIQYAARWVSLRSTEILHTCMNTSGPARLVTGPFG